MKPPQRLPCGCDINSRDDMKLHRSRRWCDQCGDLYSECELSWPEVDSNAGCTCPKGHSVAWEPESVQQEKGWLFA